jgi:hypothetical protein
MNWKSSLVAALMLGAAAQAAVPSQGLPEVGGKTLTWGMSADEVRADFPGVVFSPSEDGFSAGLPVERQPAMASFHFVEGRLAAVTAEFATPDSVRDVYESVLPGLAAQLGNPNVEHDARSEAVNSVRGQEIVQASVELGVNLGILFAGGSPYEQPPALAGERAGARMAWAQRTPEQLESIWNGAASRVTLRASDAPHEVELSFVPIAN